MREAAAALRASQLPIEFRGFVEGTDLTSGKVDVVVTDGFTGNVALKVAEGTVALYSAVPARGLQELLARPSSATCWRGRPCSCCASGSTRAATTVRCSSASTASW